MTLRGRSLLIVEARAVPFARSLKRALQRAGATTLFAHDRDAALARVKEMEFSAAVVSDRFVDLVGELEMPVVLYGTQPPRIIVSFIPMPARPGAVVVALERVLQLARESSCSSCALMKECSRKVCE